MTNRLLHLPVTRIGVLVFLLGVSSRLVHAQDEESLRAAFEGRTIAVKIDMPGTADGVNIFPDKQLPLDFQQYRNEIKKYGVAIPTGMQATVTAVKVKKSLIEFQLDGGGFGTFSDLLTGGSQQDNTPRLIPQTPEERERLARARSGSRFNIRYAHRASANQLTPEAIERALDQYVQFVFSKDTTKPLAASPPNTMSAGSAQVTDSAPDSKTKIAWRARLGWDHQVFPSYVIATASIPSSHIRPPDPSTLGDGNGQIAVVVTAPTAGATVSVAVTSPGIMAPSTFEAILPIAGQTYTIAPTIAWDFAALAKNHQTRPASITLQVSINSLPVETRVERVTLRSINDCPFYALTEDGVGRPRAEPMWWMFAAYVNENAPVNEQLRREALDAGIVSNFSGYQSGNPQDVIRQVFAIWHVLQQHGFKYSNITATSAESPQVFAQQVRFVDQSIRGGQANCVDGSVLFASLMRQVGIDPLLVLMPGHMFVGFYLDSQHQQVFYLETTILGAADLRQATDPLGLKRLFAGDPSWTTFTQAWTYASNNYLQHAQEFSGQRPEYQVIDLQKARTVGILPIVSDD